MLTAVTAVSDDLSKMPGIVSKASLVLLAAAFPKGAAVFLAFPQGAADAFEIPEGP